LWQGAAFLQQPLHRHRGAGCQRGAGDAQASARVPVQHRVHLGPQPCTAAIRPDQGDPQGQHEGGARHAIRHYPASGRWCADWHHTRADAGPHRSAVVSDLSDLLVPPPGAGPPPGWGFGDDGPARYGQGVIVEWNPQTFENVVRFRGTELRDLPVMAGPDALIYQPGDIVGIMYWAPAGGSGQYWILPRMIVPGSGAAERAVAAMRSRLGQAVALAAVGEAIQVIQPEAGTGILYCGTYNSWGDPVDATDSPVAFEAAGIQAGLTGQCVVLLSAAVLLTTESGQSGSIWLSFEAVRESTSTVDVLPDTRRALSLGRYVATTAEWSQGTPARAVVVQLQPGEAYTLRAKMMQNVSSENPRSAGYLAEASMVVIPT